jgi:hypothetical protein
MGYRMAADVLIHESLHVAQRELYVGVLDAAVKIPVTTRAKNRSPLRSFVSCRAAANASVAPLAGGCQCDWCGSSWPASARIGNRIFLQHNA